MEQLITSKLGSAIGSVISPNDYRKYLHFNGVNSYGEFPSPITMRPGDTVSLDLVVDADTLPWSKVIDGDGGARAFVQVNKDGDRLDGHGVSVVVDGSTSRSIVYGAKHHVVCTYDVDSVLETVASSMYAAQHLSGVVTNLRVNCSEPRYYPLTTVGSDVQPNTLPVTPTLPLETVEGSWNSWASIVFHWGVLTPGETYDVYVHNDTEQEVVLRFGHSSLADYVVPAGAELRTALTAHPDGDGRFEIQAKGEGAVGAVTYSADPYTHMELHNVDHSTDWRGE